MISARYFSPLIIMNCLLLEPLISQIIGVYVEIDEIPGVMTWISVIIIFVALNLL